MPYPLHYRATCTWNYVHAICNFLLLFILWMHQVFSVFTGLTATGTWCFLITRAILSDVPSTWSKTTRRLGLLNLVFVSSLKIFIFICFLTFWKVQSKVKMLVVSSLIVFFCNNLPTKEYVSWLSTFIHPANFPSSLQVGPGVICFHMAPFVIARVEWFARQIPSWSQSSSVKGVKNNTL